ncbi:MAG: DEAD/DEAH box helicase, partial [Prolixibacteraceae bacterium]|nr:DEAD/DEAH box helicase [Prolixibacteraceae bacterium]
LLELTDKQNRNVQSLVLCPTRELCLQITSDFEKFMAFSPGFNVVAVYGGASIETQIRAIKKGAHFVVGTPGRTLDLIKRKALKVDNIKWLVLDEADEMLNMGFKEDLDAILEGTPKEKRTFLFSATMPNEIADIAKNYMSVSEKITIGKQNAGAENVNHEYYMVHARDRYEALKRIADIHPKIYCIVFCRTRMETKEVADKMMDSGYNADALHGDLSQQQRTYVMNRFRSRQLQILVATDVAARGLDVDDLSHVINYNLPDDLEVYVHRSGRTGRAGKKGTSIAIIHTREKGKIRQLEKSAKISFERKMVPNGREICEKQLFNMIDKIENVEVEEKQIDQFLDVVYKKLDWLSKEDLIKKVVSVEFNRFLTYYKNSPDLNVEEQSGRERRDGRGRERNDGRRETRNRDNAGRKERSKNRGDVSSAPRIVSSSKYTRFYINVGTKKGMDVPGLIGLIKETTRDRNIPIGKIDLMKKFSFFEVDKSNAPLILDTFKNVSHGSEKILVEESKPFAPGMGFEKPKSGSPEDFKLKKKKKDFGKNDRKKRSWN